MANYGGGIFFGVLFTLIAAFQVAATLRVITTSPGYIPEEKDWDMIVPEDLSEKEVKEEEEQQLLKE